MRFFQKQFEKAFCPRNEFANLQKNHTLESQKKVIGLIYRWKTRVFWKFIKKSPYSDFHFRCSKTPLHVTFLHFFGFFFSKISPTSHTVRIPPIFTIDLSPLISLFSPFFKKRFPRVNHLFKKKKFFFLNLYLWFQKKISWHSMVKLQNFIEPTFLLNLKKSWKMKFWSLKSKVMY